MPQWLHALVPTTPGEWWTAIAAIVTAVAVVYAIRGTRYAASTLRIEQTPVLTLEHKHDDDSIRLRNIGRGVAQPRERGGETVLVFAAS